MNLALASAIVAASVGVSVAIFLLLRRHAPPGGWFTDGDRAAGVLGLLATGFAVLLGFIVFLAFGSYDAAQSGARAEATDVIQQFETAQLLPRPASSRLSGELVCYGRAVVGIEWPLPADQLIVSARDAAAPRLAEIAGELPFRWHP